MPNVERRNQGVHYLAGLGEKTLNLLENMTAKRHWLLSATLLATAISLLFAFPSRETWNTTSSRAQAVSVMMQNLNAFWSSLGPSSSIHDRVIAYRVTVPLLAHLTGLNLSGVYVLQAFVGVALLAVVVLLAYRSTGDRVCATLFGLCVATIWAGQSAFVTRHPLFDAYAFLFLLLAMLIRQPVLIIVFSVLAAFTDERALVASGFVLLWWILNERSNVVPPNGTPPEGASERLPKRFFWRAAAVVGAGIVYLALRMAIQRHYHLRTETSNFEFGKLINNSAFATWTAFEGAWLLVALAMVVLALRRRWMFLLVFVGVMFVNILGAISITDMTRSMAYLLPGLVVALCVVAQDTDVAALRKVLLVSAVGCILWPAYYAGGKSTIWWIYPLPIQIVRMVTGAGGETVQVD